MSEVSGLGWYPKPEDTPGGPIQFYIFHAMKRSVKPMFPEMGTEQNSATMPLGTRLTFTARIANGEDPTSPTGITTEARIREFRMTRRLRRIQFNEGKVF